MEERKYDDASRSFARVLDPKTTPKFFLHWYWRMIAQLGLSDVWLASGNLRKARLAADRFVQSALATAERELPADWELLHLGPIHKRDPIPYSEHWTRRGAFMPPGLYRQAKNNAAAEVQRARAEGIILALANSFAPDDPVRTAFLAAAPVRRIRTHPSGSDATRSPAACRHDESRSLRHQRPHRR